MGKEMQEEVDKNYTWTVVKGLVQFGGDEML